MRDHTAVQRPICENKRSNFEESGLVGGITDRVAVQQAPPVNQRRYRPDPYSRMRRTRGSTLDDEAGLRDAYAAHAGELYRMARRTLGDSGLAEEAVQETFLRAWRAADRYDREAGSLRTWLFAIARNVAIDLLRARRSRPEPVELDTERAEHAKHTRTPGIDPFETKLRSWEIEEALQHISNEHRQAIVETYYRGRSSAEVAAEVGVPEGTVRSRLFYGLKSLRLALEERGWSR